VVERDGAVWLYYGGWSRRASVPYSNWTGLAVSEDGGSTFHKAYAGPVLDRTRDEIYSATGAFMLERDGIWHTWYASGIDWQEIRGRWEERYVIKHAASDDGIQWLRDNEPLLPSRRAQECTHRPTVLEFDGAYHMWFCHRGLVDFRDGADAYRIGYAVSDDLRSWRREDERGGLDPSASGWDAKMTAYPYGVQTGKSIYLFYNGNAFGAAGFGYAVLERD
jgi:sucrose-6-phosphate hydrolase SacC (GH32 family)